jgi:hypothetical protein
MIGMAASTSGTKTVTKDVAPHLTAAVLTHLLSLPVESLTVAQLQELLDAVRRLPHGEEPAVTLGSLLV